ncbi:hypothetical protein [Lacimicrobium alkaliphilum]|uniref:Uncharacterized protein n=1 Tax=Lacimicrobium alkaliphilum TaxID=1526571 RepID=A0ABQ1RRC3_9ALTE|nr:hypothetical protein [Lacimicrobium alkaliphilum]GGD75496.1 hypothetical protein GCM10011357_33180 [Lacimicrobium alkaliphilum]
MKQDSGTSKQDPHTGKEHRRSEKLSHHDAEVASPEEGSLCGEEDPGSALESLIDDEKDKNSR